jgi:ABC-2 type transport system permease protein
MLQRIWAMVQKEFIQTLRDRRTLAIMLLLPMAQLFIFGYAIHMDVEHIPLAVADQSLDRRSHAYVEALEMSGFFDVAGYFADQDAVIAALDRGEVQAGLVIPAGFQARVQRGEAQVLFLVDGTDVFTAQSAYNAATRIAQVHATKVLLEQMTRSGRLQDGADILPLEARLRVLYNPDLTDLWFVIPGMIAMLLQTQSVVLTAAAVVREREVGTIEQLLVTPIRSGELMLGKIAPNLLIAMFNMLSIVGLGVFVFGVPVQGSFWLLVWMAFLFVFSGLGLGVLISTVSQNQRQAQQIALAINMMGLVLGGFMFPRYAMPTALRLVGNLLPLTYFIPISRGIMTKGIGLRFMWEQVAALGFYIVVIVSAAARFFHTDLE